MGTGSSPGPRNLGFGNGIPSPAGPQAPALHELLGMISSPNVTFLGVKPQGNWDLAF